jgi:hypothetical protein
VNKLSPQHIAFHNQTTITCIICFKIKNPPTVHLPRKYNRQRRRLLFLVCLQVSEKSGVMRARCGGWVVPTLNKGFVKALLFTSEVGLAQIIRFFFSLVLFVTLRNKETLQAGGDVGDSEKDTEHSSQATRDWQETLLALMAN